MKIIKKYHDSRKKKLWYRYYLDEKGMKQNLYECYYENSSIWSKGYYKDNRKINLWLELGGLYKYYL